ncbi:MAG: nucleotide sugar dehydrogenase [Phycisphaerales bacterium]|nr:nucleotide sugar dehydrogenase [Phycisphaerales bacterium]
MSHAAPAAKPFAQAAVANGAPYPKMATELIEKLNTRTATVGVMGLGYVGLPLLACFHDAGMKVIGYDIDPEKPRLLHNGENYLPHLGSDLCRAFKGSDRFLATTDAAALNKADAIIVCVPTPLGRHMEPDLSYVENTGRTIGPICRPGQLIVLESTSFPGTTREVMVPAIIETAKGWTPRLGEDFFVAFSPEREDPGRKSHSTRTIPKLVGGLDKASGDAAVALYKQAIETVVPCATAEVAEAAKVFENVFRCINIALVNELKMILEPMGIDVWDVIAAASTKPFGFMPFYPGPGLGGHCIPIDPFYLSWKAKEFKVPARFIELAGEVNNGMPHWVVHRIAHAFNERSRSIKGSKILVMGLAYKPDIADDRESPSFELITLLEDLGATVDYTDPHVPQTKPVRKHDLGKVSVPFTAENLRKYDMVLISTNHKAFDYAMLAREAKLVVDTRNAMSQFAPEMGDRLVKA